MALVLDEDQTLIQDSAREFCAGRTPVGQLRELRDRRDALGYDASTWNQMAALGWAGIVVPETYGGTGFGWQALGVILEQTGRSLTASPLFATVALGASALLLAADEQQRSDLLPALAAGELTFALALEEGPHHAPYGVATSARRDGDGWVLDGSKTFVLDGHSADRLVVVARTAGAPGDRDGLGLFLVDPAADGVERTRTLMADSRNAARIELRGVRVGADAVLGRPEAAAEVLDALLDRARICLAAELLGTAQEAFERTVAYLKEREQFGVVIGSFQGLKHRAADLFAELELARSVVLDALSALDEDRDDVPLLASLAKGKVATVAQRVTNEAIQMHGGIGMTDEHEIGFFLKRSRVAEQAFGGPAFHQDRYAALAGF